MVEPHHVLVNVLPICDGQMVKFMLCVTDWIMRAKIGPEFSDKFLIVLHPRGMKVGGVYQEEVGFEPS